MRTIRYNTFETNSSSTHCITMLDKSDYDHWTNEEIFIDINDGDKVYDLKDLTFKKEDKKPVKGGEDNGI